MTGPILITGATGRLGKLVVQRLLDNGERVRVLTRRPDDALVLWGDRVEIVRGDFADLASLKEAALGTRALFLLSPISEYLVTYQTAVIDAAKAAGVSRIVKISGSDWTIRNADRSVSGAAHRAVEEHLTVSGIEHAVLRPNAWMQVGLAPVIAAARKGEDLPTRYGDAAVSFIDAQDIADVAVHALVAQAPITGPLILTGTEALTALEIARIIARVLQRPIGVSQKPSSALPPHLDPFDQRAIGEFVQLIGEGLAASVTDTITQITGQQPRTVETYVRNQFAAPPIKTNDPKGEKTWH
ncbi:SDR family oxidoreductase [Agrobacterium sp. rho-13.3]|uniref:SDR family oxidoreductase n=1 Tax=Agrobacterium sp. rho-13.3 TaxID=3072980 RepID=UPI002A0FF94B|nr:NmrA family NAD(P)-binding protein [Agrobacterium sp. rho-13.3]MDX8308448.1 NmrA family NAD(P)-binding protein [Agrobacterium sp. rho-13.3]